MSTWRQRCRERSRLRQIKFKRDRHPGTIGPDPSTATEVLRRLISVPRRHGMTHSGDSIINPKGVGDPHAPLVPHSASMAAPHARQEYPE